MLKTRRIGFKRRVGNGGGKLRRKCQAWAQNLVREGCRWIAVVHDLDENNEQQLRALLTDAIDQAGAQVNVILIPKREIEAWLLYDAAAIAAAFKETQRPKLPGNPESLVDPKKYLYDLIRKKYRKDYLNTVHNELIAKHVNVRLLRRCGSFAPHPIFVNTIKNILR